MRNRLLIVIIISLSFAFTASGQKELNSPYARFNLGMLQPEGSFRSLGMGGTGTAMRDNSAIYKTEYNELSKKYTLYGSSDTISYISDNSPTYIPGTLRLGISFGKKNKFTAGADYIATNWSKSKIPGSVGYAADTKEIKAGAEFIPDKYSNYSFFNRVEYRIGGHIGDNYLIINGEQIKEYGASIGFGIPMRRTLSKTNLYFDFTKKTGSFANSLHNENYLTMGLSLNLYDFWFLKRKYD
jgi:hypothetical protein